MTSTPNILLAIGIPQESIQRYEEMLDLAKKKIEATGRNPQLFEFKPKSEMERLIVSALSMQLLNGYMEIEHD